MMSEVQHAARDETPATAPSRRNWLATAGLLWRDWKQKELKAHPWFWLTLLLLLALAAAMRTYHLDMPPLDFPADRQHSNASKIELFRAGDSLFSSLHSWIELWMLPWITARTSWLRHLLRCEIWTLARLWSVFFGLLTVAMSAYAGYWAAAAPGAPEARRRRIALLWMAAMALNPYHQAISRMITTESLTLAMQMCAVGFFWAGARHPGQSRYFILFIIFFMLAGWAKIPSVIWLPAFVLCYLFQFAQRPRARLLGAGLVTLGILAILLVSRINPFAIYQSYARHYAYFAMHTGFWMGHALWNQTYLTRILLMLTLPGVFFAIIGLACAPWLFRITIAVFLALFYGLVNLNIYNFSHVIIPGMALAAWGANSLIEAAAEAARPHSRAGLAGGGLLVLAIVFLLNPFSPTNPNPSVPRAEILQAAKVIKERLPQGTYVSNDDREGSLNYLLRQWQDAGDFSLDLRTGWFYSFKRDRALQYAGKAWVKWANLPGEPVGILYTRQPSLPSPKEAAAYWPLKFQPGMQKSPSIIDGFFIPKAAYDPARRVLHARPGSSLKIGITWKNDLGAPLAGMRWSSAACRQFLPVPIREGGLAISYGGVLCLPGGSRPTAYYTFDFPAGMPIGSYSINCYFQDAAHWRSPDSGMTVFPFNVELAGGDAIPETIESSYSDLYTAEYCGGPTVWSERWFFRNMKLEGYRTNDSLTHVLSCPLRQPGLYALTIEGEAKPVSSPTNPRDLWPVVEAYLPRDKITPVTRLSIDSEQTGSYQAIFTAGEPFDALLLKACCGSSGGEMPFWQYAFNPATYGHQVMTLRRVRLELKRPLLPGLLDSQPKK